MTILSAAITLLLVMDPLGGIPLFTAVLRHIEPQRRTRIIFRECAIAFVVLLVFLLFGDQLLHVLHLSHPAMGIAGGIILFLIAVRMVFPTAEGVFGDLPEGDPFIVPLAVPLIAGPSAIAAVLLLVSHYPTRLPEWILALTGAVLVTAIILALGEWLTKYLGYRTVLAIERLMGMILTALAVEMLLGGVRDFLHLRV